MAPLPEEKVCTPGKPEQPRVAEPPPGHEVVISGISGNFPESDSVRDFMRNLYNKVDMISDDDRRWAVDHPDIPRATGKIGGIDKFDAQFFGVHYKQAWCMDPMGRLLLENTFGAVIDAGMNPRELRKTNTAVCVGAATSDAEKMWYFDKTQISGFGLTGTARSKLPNRISYWLGTQGPSFLVNTTCSSGLHVLQLAYDSIRSGQCDAAVVAACNICAHPFISLLFNRMGLLSKDGKTRCFGEDAAGYGRAETVGVIFLQKAKDAKRAYAQIVHAKANCDGYNSERVTYPRKETIRSFLEDFYNDIDVLPASVQYVEAFGAGLREIDKNELDAIDEVFCKGRQQPLLVGCVKSNMGHAEAASGVAAVTKICLAYHTGELAPNLHYGEPRGDVAGVREGRVRVVTETTAFPDAGYAAASSYSFSGVNVHVLFKGLQRTKKEQATDELPRLVTLSGRSEESLRTIFEELESLPLNVEQIRLLHNIHESTIPGHVFRAYNLLQTEKGSTVSLAQHADYFPGLKRPVWFVYSGMGSQWSGMGTQLLRIPIFAAAIERCCRALAPKGVDLMRILTDPDPNMYDNILHSFVGIAAVQIGLTDILTALGIKPDNIIGHSVGELGCAYADGCFTAEEMILSAYSRGLVSIQTPFIRGSMAAVGVGYDQMKSQCPPEIEVACHNGPDSCTISGPADIMKSFVGELTARGIFAKEVPCSNIAYHSRYIAEAGPELLKYLREVIKVPKPRSSRWLSTSVPQKQWDQPDAKLSSAEYHTNNLLRPVLFEETSRHIPPNAITIEVAPHGLLQAILRRSLAADCIHVPLTKRRHADNVHFLLEALGKLFVAGINVKIANIYPSIQFPVSATTPLLSHLVSWEHSENWGSHLYYPKQRIKSGERHCMMSTCDEEYKYLIGHVVDGVNTFPAAGYLLLAWETLGMMQGVHYSKLSVVFEGVRFESDAVLCARDTLELIVMIHKATGNFEVTAEGGLLASGRVYTAESSQLLRMQDPLELPRSTPEESGADSVLLDSDDVYTIMASRGYSYRDEFRSIRSADVSASKGRIKFSGNWVTLLDGLLQMNVLRRLSSGISKPKLIRKLIIDTEEQQRASCAGADCCLDVTVYQLYDRTRCGGVELEGLVLTERARRVPQPPLLQLYTFLPYLSTPEALQLQDEDSVRVLVHTAVQNTIADQFNVIEFVNDNMHTVISSEMENYLRHNEHTEFDVKKTPVGNIFEKSIIFSEETSKANLLVFSNFNRNTNVMERLCSTLSAGSWVLNRELPTLTTAPASMAQQASLACDALQVVSVRETPQWRLTLLRKRSAAIAGGRGDDRGTKYIAIKSGSELPWLRLLQAEWRSCDRLVLISECDPCAGLLGLFNCLRREPGGHALALLLIDDCNAPAFRPDLPFYREQLAKDLAINIYRNGTWGSYQYVPLSPVSLQREHVYLASQRPEDISSLAWLEGPLTTDARPERAANTLVHVYYSSVSHMDMRKASGRLRFESIDQQERLSGYGMEFCGRTNTGERVMGMRQSGALSSLVEADVDLLWPVPAHWSMEDAATVPLAYANAFYCLELRAGLLPGMSVLIHSGCSSLGQAAISICLARGCEVFTTVSSVSKKQWLLKLFPGLKRSNIGNSRSADFEDMVMSRTSEGCNVVLNTLSGELRTVSMRCLSPMGTFVNVNEDDFLLDSSFGMAFLKLNRTFKAASVANLFRPCEGARRDQVQRMLAEGIARGHVQPLNRVVLEASEAPRAFRFTSTGRHVGKVLLKLRDEELRPLVTPSRALFAAQPHFLCSDHGNYVVVSASDPEHSGLALADWLVQRGARNLLLHGADGDNGGGYRAFRVRCWRRRGVKVQFSADNLCTEAGCLQLLTDAARQGPVLGVFVAPRSSQRALFEHARVDRFAEELAQKARVIANLDSATRKLCPSLEQFVVWSRTAAGSGTVDSVLERVCEERGRLGLPAVAVQQQEPSESWGIADGLDQLLASGQNVVAVSTATVSDEDTKNSVLKAVSSIIGIVNPSDLSDEETLQQYGVDSETAQEIQSVLEREFSIYCTTDKIMTLTKAELKKMKLERTEKRKETLEGLKGFFRYADPEEFNVGDPIVRMPTLLSDGLESAEETFDKDTCLIMIPGMEGHKNIFSTIAQRLKIDAFTCQLEFDHFDDGIEGMAFRMSQVILKKMRPEGKFLLLGYSFGVTVALEVAANLEEKGHEGQVFCLDGSPRWFAALLEAQLGHLSEQRLQNEVIEHMFRVMLASGGGSGGGDEQEALRPLQRSLAAESDWECKLDACMRHLRGRVNFSFQYQRSLVAMAYARIRQARAYSDARLLSHPLRSELVLLSATRRPRSLSAAAEALGRDLGLGAYSQRPVLVYELDADHVAAPYDLHVTDILNKHLVDPEEFKATNLCDLYVTGYYV